ncbi:hypothetical protein PENVUL_c001G07393 [Penicillium vulpinum]|uniref:Uncharacterized protein n=1 Tax=Penicillium vulpinum TaxID=29845 RepID=A0A1V6SDI5_9EURO|nr:hypothetical protein PENVUL_c001G07393 [Penicillium vulpinum]
MAWPSQNIDQDSLEFPAEQEGISDSIFPQLALVRPGDASTWTSPWLYSQPNHLARNDTPYYVVNNNNPQAIPTAFLGPTNHITSATPLEAHVIQRAHCQELPQSGVIGNANNTNGRPPVHRQGCGQE